MGVHSKFSSPQFGINIMEFLVLMVNVIKARQLSDEVGYVDYYMKFERLLLKAEKHGLSIHQPELEALLAAANFLDERGEFWNYKDQSLMEFVNALINPHAKHKYFNVIYNQIRERPKRGRPSKSFDVSQEREHERRKQYSYSAKRKI